MVIGWHTVDTYMRILRCLFLLFGMYILAQKWVSAFSADTELKLPVPILTRLTTETGLL